MNTERMNMTDLLRRERLAMLGRWVWEHRAARWSLLVLGGWMAVIGMFYAVEDWRGKQAWESCKRELEAKGRNLNWEAAIPPATPDEQNFFKAPNMQQWFTGRGGNTLSAKLSLGNYSSYLEERNQNTVANVSVVPMDATIAPGTVDLVLRYQGPHSILLSAEDNIQLAKNLVTASSHAAADQLNILMSAAVEAAANGKAGLMCDAPLGFKLVADSLGAIKPVRVAIRSDTPLRSDQINQCFPAVGLGKQTTASQLGVHATDSNNFFVTFNNPPYITAASYIAWSDSLQPDLDAIHAALMRPFARMEGDYSDPTVIPIPNFVCSRIMAQLLAQRTQSYLLLDQPEKALREQLFIRDLCRLMEGRPTAKPMTLVAAMINVAVTGLYVSTFADGVRLHEWREPELKAIEEQLSEVDLQKYVYSALEGEALWSERWLGTKSGFKLAESFSGNRNQTLWEKWTDPTRLYCVFAPRGWMYQNMTTAVRLQEQALEGFDRTNQVILPRIWDAGARRVEKEFKHVSPYTYLAAQMVPNFSRALQTMAKNQTLVNEAYMVCALERYRMARGYWPETLDRLAPQFAEKIPADLIGGAPLKYQVKDGKFTLYSIGWNEKDDGGIPAWKGTDNGDLTKNDWVWPYAQ